jgi:hypothetical protein
MKLSKSSKAPAYTDHGPNDPRIAWEAGYKQGKEDIINENPEAIRTLIAECNARSRPRSRKQ